MSARHVPLVGLAAVPRMTPELYARVAWPESWAKPGARPSLLAIAKGRLNTHCKVGQAWLSFELGQPVYDISSKGREALQVWRLFG